MTPGRFTEEVQTYTVLLLDLGEYRSTARKLPDGFKFLEPVRRDLVRDQEKRLLEQIFEDWEIPYDGQLRGWRADSPVFVMKGEQLVGGVYLCEKNEFDEEPARGQLHYFFVHPSYRTRKLHSVNVNEAVRRARAWGLQKVYINTDRAGLPEVYIRWGAKSLKQIAKSSRLPHNAVGNRVRQLWRQARLVSKTLRDTFR